MSKKAKTSFRYDESKTDYIIGMKKRKNLWWLLLLLLLAPLFINLEKDITVTVLDTQDNPVSAAKVDFEFVSSYLYKQGKFFYNDTISGRRSERTDATGVCVFKDCGYSVYGMIFKFSHRVAVDVSSDCFKPAGKRVLYHYLFGNYTVWVEKEIADLTVQVLDKNDREPVSNATVYFKCNRNNAVVTDSVTTNAAGKIVIKNIEKCGLIDLLGRCYGYKDENRNVKIEEALASPEKATLLLEPLENSFTFFVENCNSRARIPGAKAIITITKQNGKSSKNVTYTNTSGRAIGVGEGKGHVIAQLDITASKAGFKDGKLNGNYTVEEFTKLSDEKRTICLEPEPCTLEYHNIDSLFQTGIAGVTNRVTVTSTTRTEMLDDIISNTKGVFSITPVYDGDNLAIESIHPDYEPKQTTFVVNPADKSKKIIRMMPLIDTLKFSVLDAIDKFEVITRENVKVTLSQNQINIHVDSLFIKEINAQGWVFRVIIFRPYPMSIKIESNGYKDNHQITDVMPIELKNDDTKRIILMELNDCQDASIANGIITEGSDDVREYNLGKNSGSFEFSYNTNTQPDHIIVFDGRKGDIGKAPVIFEIDAATGDKWTDTTLQFTNPVITVQVKSKSPYCAYKINCPK